ncbi:alpha-L-rhamnosidase C-terminal domain-containing protein, partial [Oscillatoria laete-virens NRMC-F 0139]
WNIHRFTGDQTVLSEHYEGMNLWRTYLSSHAEGHIITTYESGHWSLGDWCCPRMSYDDAHREAHEINPPPEIVWTWVYWNTTRLLAEISGALGHRGHREHLIAESQKIAHAFHQRFYDERRGYYGSGCHGADVFALHVLPIPLERASRARAHLIEHLTGLCQTHFDTGIFGTPMLLDLLAQSGLIDLAFSLLTRKSYPSYGWMLENDATTLWETWAGDQGVSHCHPALASVNTFFYKHLAGIQPVCWQNGIQIVHINPKFPLGLDRVSAECAIPSGRIHLQWSRVDAHVELAINIPPRVQAHFKAAGADCFLTPGQNKLRLEL